MATATTKKTPAPANTMKWGDEDVQVLAGFELVDKSTLVDKPFCITGARMIVTNADVEMVQVECELDPRTHEKVVFQDSSTGVKSDMEQLMKVAGWSGEVDKWVDFKFLAPNGLRASTYDKDLGGGKTTKATTYYLTKANSGRAE